MGLKVDNDQWEKLLGIISKQGRQTLSILLNLVEKQR